MNRIVRGIFLGSVALFGGITAQAIPKPAPVNKAQLHEWINSHCAEDKRFGAQWYAQNLRHVPFNEFRDQLRETTHDFERSVGDDPYALVLPRTKHSEEWVTKIAQNFLKKAPFTHVVGLSRDALTKVYNKVKHFAVFDDGIYSGEQMISTVNRLSDYLSLFSPRNHTIHIVVPFIKDIGKELLQASKNLRNCLKIS